jgi:hypothetical protein
MSVVLPEQLLRYDYPIVLLACSILSRSNALVPVLSDSLCLLLCSAQHAAGQHL